MMGGVGWGEVLDATKTWRKPRFPNCKRCKNDGADSWACLNLFEAKIAFRLGEIHIYFKNHQIQTSEFQSFCNRWIVFSPRRNDDFLKKNSTSRPHFPVRRDVYLYIYPIYVITILAKLSTPSPGQATVWSVACHRSTHEGEGEDAHLASTHLCRWGYGQATESKNHSYLSVYIYMCYSKSNHEWNIPWDTIWTYGIV